MVLFALLVNPLALLVSALLKRLRPRPEPDFSPAMAEVISLEKERSRRAS